MTFFNELTALVIGYGSVGRRHAAALANLADSLAIVEINEAGRSRALETYPAATVVDSLEALEGKAFPWESTLGVIATWGPSHADLFHALADRGVRRILCEKPMASSVAQAQRMATRAGQDGIALAVHHFIRYTRLAPALRQFAAENQLGEPEAVIVHGGAAGLITNGLHWIDFATQLFGEPPQRVISTANGEPINPRSPDVLLYGGVAVWSFNAGREAVISFSNRSSLKLTAQIYFRDTVAETDSDSEHITVRRRDPVAVANFPAITRTGPATELLFAGVLPGMRSFNEGLKSALQEVASGEVSTCPGLAGVSALSASIGMLLAAREEKAIDLPLDPAGLWGQESWPIS